MPNTSNRGRAYTRQDGRIQVHSGNLLLMPPGHRFRRMTLEQLEQINPSKLSAAEKAGYCEALESRMQATIRQMRRLGECQARRGGTNK